MLIIYDVRKELQSKKVTADRITIASEVLTEKMPLVLLVKVGRVYICIFMFLRILFSARFVFRALAEIHIVIGSIAASRTNRISRTILSPEGRLFLQECGRQKNSGATRSQFHRTVGYETIFTPEIVQHYWIKIATCSFCQN